MADGLGLHSAKRLEAGEGGQRVRLRARGRELARQLHGAPEVLEGARGLVRLREELTQRRLGLGRPLRVVRGEERVPGRGQLLVASPLGEAECLPVAKQEPRTVAVVERPELERLAIEAGCDRREVESDGSLGGGAQGDARGRSSVAVSPPAARVSSRAAR